MSDSPFIDPDAMAVAFGAPGAATPDGISESSEGWSADRMNAMSSSAPTPRRQQLRGIGADLRSVIAQLVSTDASDEDLAVVAAAIGEARARLATTHVGTFLQRRESALAGDVHAFFDDSPLLGQANPIAPPLDLRVVDEGEQRVVRGDATFGPQYEGPPGCVHGGMIAAAFDEVLGMAQSLGGAPGMTGTLTVKYRSPTPLGTPLTFYGEVSRVEGRKRFTYGSLHAGDRLCAEAEGIFIAVDFSKLAQAQLERADNA